MTKIILSFLGTEIFLFIVPIRKDTETVLM